MESREQTGTGIQSITLLGFFIERNYGKLALLGLLGSLPIGIAVLRDGQLSGRVGGGVIDIIIAVLLLLVVGVAGRTFVVYAYEYISEPGLVSAVSRPDGRMIIIMLVVIVSNAFIFTLLPEGFTVRWTGVVTQLLFGGAFLSGWIFRKVSSR